MKSVKSPQSNIELGWTLDLINLDTSDFQEIKLQLDKNLNAWKTVTISFIQNHSIRNKNWRRKIETEIKRNVEFCVRLLGADCNEGQKIKEPGKIIAKNSAVYEKKGNQVNNKEMSDI
jgi:hypothetical protein